MLVRLSRARIARLVLALAATLATLGFLFVWSGLYSVAASRGHWAIMEWMLTFAMRSSVRTHAIAIEVPPLDRADLVALGAAHFHSGCAHCHGAPGVPIGLIPRGMLPPPPDLAKQMRPWRDRELFWIVQNGIKYTGMPAWAAPQRGDEVWALVAFLRRLPALDERGYRALALGETTAAAAGDCARCHGAERNAPPSALVPVLHGQPVAFLAAALEAYAGGRRASGIMQPLAFDLAQDERARIAGYYAALQPLPPRSGIADAAVITRGRQIAEAGDPGAGIPPCAPCHGPDALKIYPRLAGQNVPYMVNRLRRWKDGFAPGTETETIMAPIARALSARQIDDVAAYYASVASAP
jgi:cytochrome c553